MERKKKMRRKTSETWKKKNRKYILESDVNIITWSCALDNAWLKSAMAMNASEVIVIRLVPFFGLDRAHLSIVF